MTKLMRKLESGSRPQATPAPNLRHYRHRTGDLLTSIEEGGDLGRGKVRGVCLQGKLPNSMTGHVEVRDVIGAGIGRSDVRTLVRLGTPIREEHL